MNWRWDSDDKVIDIQIEHPRLAALYTPFHDWSRVLALIAALISMGAYAIAALTAVAFALDAVSVILLVVAITRVATDSGSVTKTSATPLQAEETVEYRDESG